MCLCQTMPSTSFLRFGRIFSDNTLFLGVTKQHFTHCFEFPALSRWCVGIHSERGLGLPAITSTIQHVGWHPFATHTVVAPSS